MLQVRVTVDMYHSVPRILWGSDNQTWERWTLTLTMAQPRVFA